MRAKFGKYVAENGKEIAQKILCKILSRLTESTIRNSLKHVNIETLTSYVFYSSSRSPPNSYGSPRKVDHIFQKYTQLRCNN